MQDCAFNSCIIPYVKFKVLVDFDFFLKDVYLALSGVHQP